MSILENILLVLMDKDIVQNFMIAKQHSNIYINNKLVK
jgi:hypothetical protein